MSRLPDLRLPGAAAMLLAAAGLAWHGQPDVQQKWAFLAPRYEARLIEREVYIDPAELLHLMNDDYIDLLIFDVRSESDWNQFHLADSECIPLDQLPAQRERLRALPENAVLVVVSNDEILATEAWKRLKGRPTQLETKHIGQLGDQSPLYHFPGRRSPLVIDDKKITEGLVDKVEPNVAAYFPEFTVVLNQCVQKHLIAERIVHPGCQQIRIKLAAGQFDIVVCPSHLGCQVIIRLECDPGSETVSISIEKTTGAYGSQATEHATRIALEEGRVLSEVIISHRYDEILCDFERLHQPFEP